ncbi:hypothetical protein AALC17_19715 [Oscillospiraceae bacterium 38-13]
MRSKTSYFNPALFRKNLTRFWPLWGGASFIGALFPLALLAVLIQSGELDAIQSPLEITCGYYSVVAYLLPVLSLFYGALCALAAWGWLYNPRSVGMFHSLPITRKSLFLTDFLSGMSMMLIPYAVTGVLAVLISAAIRGLEPVGLAVTVLCVLGESFFYFCFATLMVFVTGNPFAFAGFYFLFHFLAAGAEWLVSLLMNQFYFGVSRSYEGVIEFLSPTLYLTRRMEVLTESQRITTPDGWVETGALESVTLANGWLVGTYALAGLVLLAGAWALYRRRRSECAGDVVAVGWMKPVFRYGVALCAAFTGGLLLYALFCDGFQSLDGSADALPMAVCMAVAGVIGYYIASMLLSKSLQVFRGSWKGVLATGIAAAALCLTIAADPFGVETRIPESAESVALYISGIHGSGVNAVLEDPGDIDQVRDLHWALLAERDSLGTSTQQIPADQDMYNVMLVLRYYLPGDKMLHRYYDLYLTEEMLAGSEALRQLAELACAPGVQSYDIFSHIYTGGIESRLTSGSISGILDAETGEQKQVDLTPEQARILEEAVGRDVEAGNFGKTLFITDWDQYQNSTGWGKLTFFYASTSLDGRWQGQRSQSVDLGISIYCTETHKALEEAGIVDETHKFLTRAENDALHGSQGGGEAVYYDDPYYDYGYPEEVYEEIY